MSKQPPNTKVLDKIGGREVPAGALVDELAKDGVKRDDAVRSLIDLQGKRVLSVVEPRPYATLWSYFASPYSLWFWGALAAVAASVGLIWVTSGVVLYARYVFGSALVLFLPGFALIEALYPRKHSGPQVERVGVIRADMDDELTRFALSIGLSLAIVPLTGLVLNYTPFGIRLLPVTFSIAGLTVAFLVAAVYRRHLYYKLSKGVG